MSLSDKIELHPNTDSIYIIDVREVRKAISSLQKILYTHNASLPALMVRKILRDVFGEELT